MFTLGFTLQFLVLIVSVLFPNNFAWKFTLQSSSTDTMESVNREAIRSVIETFQVSPFKPSRLYRNCHWQTIVGSGALSAKLFGNPPRGFSTYSEIVSTPDEDYFEVEFTTGFENADKIVIMLHGLESNTKGPLITQFTQAFLKPGREYGCALVSFRGCNGKPNLTPGAYHLGFTNDLDQLVSILHKRYPQKSMYLCGFSLGGNVILKFLGEQGETVSQRCVKGAAVTCVPFDPIECQKKLDVGFNRAVYSNNFLKTLKVKAEVEHQQFPNAFDLQRIKAARTIGDFDDAYIAPVYGFKDKLDYYSKTGSKWWLHKIRIPVIAINARDDPFIEEKSLPTDKDLLPKNVCYLPDEAPMAPVRLIYHDNGGHCGFYTDQESMNSDDSDKQQKVPHYGWLAEELARAIQHINGRLV